MRGLALGCVVACLLAAAPAAGAAGRPAMLPVPKATGPWAQRATFAFQEYRELRRARKLTAARPRFRETAGARGLHGARPRQRPLAAAGAGLRARPRPPLPVPGSPTGAAATCSPGLAGISSLDQDDHDAALVVSVTDANDFAAYVYGPGTVAKDTCGSVTQLLSLLGSSSNTFMFTGPHTVITANVYADASRTGTPIWTGYYGTATLGSPTPTSYDKNPLVDPLPNGGRFADAWNAGTGELVIWDSLDWLKATGGCEQCDLSGYTVENMTLRAADGGMRALTATGTTFTNVTFGKGYDFTGASMRGATFDGVTMQAAAVLLTATLTGATFLGENTITAPIMNGATLDGISLSASTSITSIALTGTAPLCLSAAGADLTRGTFTIATTNTGCAVSAPFRGSQVRPTIVPLDQWNGVDWSNAVLVWERATQTYLKGATLPGLRMRNASFWGVPADLGGIDLSGAQLQGTSFTNVSLAGAVLQGVDASNATFNGADLTKAHLEEPTGKTTTFDDANFVRALLDGASFGGSSLYRTNFTSARAHGTDFSYATAIGAKFKGAHVLANPTAFEGVIFSNPTDGTDPATFEDAVMGGDKNAGTALSFAGADLSGVSFDGAQCIGCDFGPSASSTPTNLTNVDFEGAWLFGATFSSAVMPDTDFDGAVLSDAPGTSPWQFSFGQSESATDAYGVNYVATNFTGTNTTKVTSCPDGNKPDPLGGCANHLFFFPQPPRPACSASGNDACPTTVKTIAGNGVSGSSLAQVHDPQGVVVAPDAVYFADAANHVVRRISPSGTVTTIAGTGDAGDGPDGGDATQSDLDEPVGLALAADGTTLYVSDRGANRIRKITQTVDASGATSYTIWAVAGGGDWCSDLATTCGDGDDPHDAQLGAPEALWVDPVNNVYVADTQNDRVRVVVAGGGVGTIAAGTLDEPAGIAGDVNGNLFVSDTDGNTVLRIGPTGDVATIMGTGDPDYNGTYDQDPASKAWVVPKSGTKVNVNGPRGLATNLAGQLLVAEPLNGLVRRWDPQHGTVDIVAGKTKNNDTAIDTSYDNDGQYANATGFKDPNSVAVTFDGQFVVTDAGYYRVRTFGPNPTS